MHAEESSPQKDYGGISPRMRYLVGSIMLLDASLHMWKHFQRLAWVPWLCFGLYWFIFVSRRPDEAPFIYMKRPRVIFSISLLLTSLCWLSHDLYVLFATE
jgi:hypothetical protein